jgi:hypothetical protein
MASPEHRWTVAQLMTTNSNGDPRWFMPIVLGVLSIVGAWLRGWRREPPPKEESLSARLSRFEERLTQSEATQVAFQEEMRAAVGRIEDQIVAVALARSASGTH